MWEWLLQREIFILTVWWCVKIFRTFYSEVNNPKGKCHHSAPTLSGLDKEGLFLWKEIKLKPPGWRTVYIITTGFCCCSDSYYHFLYYFLLLISQYRLDHQTTESLFLSSFWRLQGALMKPTQPEQCEQKTWIKRTSFICTTHNTNNNTYIPVALNTVMYCTVYCQQLYHFRSLSTL